MKQMAEEHADLRQAQLCVLSHTLGHSKCYGVAAQILNVNVEAATIFRLSTDVLFPLAVF